MSILKFSFLFSIVLLLFHSTRSTNPAACAKTYCGNPEIQLLFEFPFLLREENYISNNQSDRCGYPGFEIFCNNKNQALLRLPNSREFVVKYISLEKQRIWVNDPNECPPRRFIQNIDLDNDSPFQWDNTYHSIYENVTFLNCTGFTKEPVVHDDIFIIPCLSNEKYSIMYTLPSPINPWINRSCREIGSAMVPVKDNSSEPQVIMEGLYSDILLRWNKPLCDCAADQFCGFETDTGLNVTCYNYNYYNQPGRNPSNSRHRNIYFFLVVWGISGILFFIWVIVSIYKDRRQSHTQQNETITNIESNNREPPWFVLGLDRSRIEQYPKIQLTESGQLPKSIDNVCSICLSEYKPMETLRSMPQCNHYFHADCIDVWLKMNATCPLCRNLPE